MSESWRWYYTFVTPLTWTSCLEVTVAAYHWPGPAVWRWLTAYHWPGPAVWRWLWRPTTDLDQLSGGDLRPTTDLDQLSGGDCDGLPLTWTSCLEVTVTTYHWPAPAVWRWLWRPTTDLHQLSGGDCGDLPLTCTSCLEVTVAASSFPSSSIPASSRLQERVIISYFAWHVVDIWEYRFFLKYNFIWRFTFNVEPVICFWKKTIRSSITHQKSSANLRSC